MPAELEIVARAKDDPTEVHAVRHRRHPVWGVQFHPESILTENGKEILRNFLRIGQ
jgi:anthranilate/para-aminobenzoate synthase component II